MLSRNVVILGSVIAQRGNCLYHSGEHYRIVPNFYFELIKQKIFDKRLLLFVVY